MKAAYTNLIGIYQSIFTNSTWFSPWRDHDSWPNASGMLFIWSVYVYICRSVVCRTSITYLIHYIVTHIWFRWIWILCIYVISCLQSCPAINIYTAENLQKALDGATSSFCSQEVQIYSIQREVHVSRIFQWYWSDFGDNDVQAVR